MESLDAYTTYALITFKSTYPQKYKELEQAPDFDPRYFTFSYNGKTKKGVKVLLDVPPKRCDANPIYAKGMTPTELGKKKVLYTRFMWSLVSFKDRIRIHRKSCYRLMAVDDDPFHFMEKGDTKA